MACPPARELGAGIPQMGPPAMKALWPRRPGLLRLM